MDQAQELVRELFDQIGEDETHGYQHALEVLKHAERALEEFLQTNTLHLDQVMAVKLAALLHDVDDSKLFQSGEDYSNAMRILEANNFNLVEDVLDMISLVSFSKNGISTVYSSSSPYLGHRSRQKHGSRLVSNHKQTKGTQHRIPTWKLIPRDADRLEALGKIGVARCFAYGAQVQRPHYDDKTPRITSCPELFQRATQNWLTKSFGSATLDYFIAGLVPRTFMSTNLNYFILEAGNRTQPIIEICLLYGQQGSLSKQDILNCVSGDPSAEALIQKYL